MYRKINAIFFSIFTFYQLEGQINLSITTQEASCSGKGSIQVIATGGKEPYSYEITDNTCGLNNRPLQSNSIFSGLSSCTYTIRVLDAEGRIASRNAVVGGNYIGPTASVLLDGCGFVISSKNGNAPIKYSISTDGGKTYGQSSSQNIFNGLANGTYYLKIEDACNSTFVLTATISLDTLEYFLFSSYPEKRTDSIKPYNISGGHGPFIFFIINGPDTLKGNNNNFAIKDIIKTCSTKVLVQSPCRTYLHDFTYIDAEFACVNQTEGNAEIKVNLGTAPYEVHMYTPSLGGQSSSKLSWNGLPKNEIYYSFGLSDACGHHNSGRWESNSQNRPEFNFKTSTSCADFQNIQLKIIQSHNYRKSLYTVECTTCSPIQQFKDIQEELSINNLNSGKKIITIKDSCGSTWTCSSEWLVPVDEKCDYIKINLVNAFVCNNRDSGFSHSGDTIPAQMYYLRNESGILIDSNTNGIFTSISNGNYLVQARNAGCGLIQGRYKRNIQLAAPHYHSTLLLSPIDGKCQYYYYIYLENTYAPYVLIDISGQSTSPMISNQTAYFPEIKPGKYLLKSLLNCWEREINLPLIAPKIKLEKINICPAGGSIEISGGNSYNQWQNVLGSNVNLLGYNNPADWYSLSSRFANFNYDTARHTYYNVEPGKTYTLYLHSFSAYTYYSEEYSCPVDSLTFTAPFYTPPTLQSDLTLKCDQSNTVLNQFKIKNGTNPYQIQEIHCTNQNNIGTALTTFDSLVIINTNNLNNHCFRVTDVCQNSSTSESSIGDLNSNIQVLKNCNATTTFYFSPIPGASYTWRNKQNIVIGNQSSVTTPDPKTGDEISLSLSYRGCTIAKSIVIDSLTARAFDIQISGDKGPDLCFGDSIRLSASISGGIGPFQYKWSNGSREDQILVRSTGIQTLEVTNGLGCRDTATLAVRVGDGLSLKYSTQSIACFGEKTGQIALKPSGGLQPFQFKWTHGPTLDSLSGLPAGPYSVSITDAAGCRITENFTLEQNPKLSLTTQTSPSTCGVSKDGILEVNSSGGASGYTYQWNTGQTTNRLTNLNPGEYTIMVTDQALCQVMASLEVLQGPEIISQRSDTICSGSSLQVGTSVYSVTGQFRDILPTSQGCDSIVLTTLTVMPFEARISADRSTDLCAGDSIRLNSLLTGGISPFTYTWTNGSRLKDNWVKTSGLHILRVVDLLGCEDTAMIQIRIGEPLSLINTTTSIACFGDSTGSIKIKAQGGIGPHRYLWSTGSVSDSINGLTAGSYEITLTDAVGCMYQEKILLVQNSSLSLNTRSQPSTCGVSQDGSAEVIPEGGAPGYSYTWNTGTTTSTLRNINPGNYTVTVTDLVACQATATVAVARGPQIMSQRTDTLCAGKTIRIGNSIYTVSGNFRDTLKTFQGCDSIVLTRLTVNPALQYLLDAKDPQCHGDENGFITVSGLNSRPPYTFELNGNKINGLIAQNLPSGNYTIKLTDGFGCITEKGAALTNPRKIELEAGQDTLLQFGDSIQLKAMTNLSPAEIKSLNWTSDQGVICNQCSTTILRPKRDLAVKVELENTAGCKIIDQFLVKVNLEFRVFAPNVIVLDPASSGTGLNSRFTLFSNQIQSIEYLRVFDRFGSLLFEAKDIPPGDINSGWDGTYHSKRVNAGVYVYLASVRFADDSVRVVSGDVTVID